MKKDQPIFKKEQVDLYCPYQANPRELFNGSMEVRLQERRAGKLVILIDYKEEKEVIKDLKGDRGIDRDDNVLEGK